MSESEKPKVIVLRRIHGKLQPEIQPIVVELKQPRKKKKTVEKEEKYSKGLGNIQRAEGDFLRVAKRSARAISKGIDTYDNERRRSAKGKKDGAIEDFMDNSAKAMSVSMKEASEIPLDIAESMSTKSYRNRLRKNLRRASRYIRIFRI
jgi:hypothetical protein